MIVVADGSVQHDCQTRYTDFIGCYKPEYSAVYIVQDPKTTTMLELEKFGVIFPFSTKINDSSFLTLEKQATKFSNLYGTIFNYLDLEDDWDGYGGIKPSNKIISAGEILIKQLDKQANLRLIPEPMLTGSGELGFYWDLDNTYIEIDIYEENKYSYFVQVDEKILLQGNDVALNEISQRFISLLKEYQIAS